MNFETREDVIDFVKDTDTLDLLQAKLKVLNQLNKKGNTIVGAWDYLPVNKNYVKVVNNRYNKNRKSFEALSFELSLK